jgi:chromosome segregation ATPase
MNFKHVCYVIGVVLFLAALVLAIMSLLALPIRAQEAAETAKQINATNDAIADLNGQITKMTDITIPKLMERKKVIDDTTAAMKKDLEKQTAKAADLGQRKNANDRNVALHNASPCKGSEAKCADWIAEGNALNIQAASIDQDRAKLLDYLKKFKVRAEQLVTDTNAWQAEIRKTVDEIQALTGKQRVNILRLSDLATTYGTCMDRYPNDDDAGLKLHCGNVAFDRVRATITVLGHTTPELWGIPKP